MKELLLLDMYVKKLGYREKESKKKNKSLVETNSETGEEATMEI